MQRERKVKEAVESRKEINEQLHAIGKRLVENNEQMLAEAVFEMRNNLEAQKACSDNWEDIDYSISKLLADLDKDIAGKKMFTASVYIQKLTSLVNERGYKELKPRKKKGFLGIFPKPEAKPTTEDNIFDLILKIAKAEGEISLHEKERGIAASSQNKTNVITLKSRIASKNNSLDLLRTQLQREHLKLSAEEKERVLISIEKMQDPDDMLRIYSGLSGLDKKVSANQEKEEYIAGMIDSVLEGREKLSVSEDVTES